MLPKIILGSSSPSRRAVMDKLNISYHIAHPDIDETSHPQETALELVQRLSTEKALVVGKHYPSHLVIACDQVAELDGEILGKPLNAETAFLQLKKQSGREIVYYSGLCLLNTSTGKQQLTVDETRVKFRALNDNEIKKYIELDKPLQCAASFKCESMGMLIVDWVKGNDIHALIGLSIVSLCRLLKNEGVDLLQHTNQQSTAGV